jgi:hypothetical protein
MLPSSNYLLTRSYPHTTLQIRSGYNVAATSMYIVVQQVRLAGPPLPTRLSGLSGDVVLLAGVEGVHTRGAHFLISKKRVH